MKFAIASVLLFAPLLAHGSTEKPDSNDGKTPAPAAVDSANAGADYGKPSTCPVVQVVDDGYSPFCDEVVPKDCGGYPGAPGYPGGNHTDANNGTYAGDNTGNAGDDMKDDEKMPTDNYSGSSTGSAGRLVAYGSSAFAAGILALIM